MLFQKNCWDIPNKNTQWHANEHLAQLSKIKSLLSIESLKYIM